MSYLALARRYRPGDFETILSQNHVTSTLKNAVKSGRISHAYLFCGPRGTGKTTTARVLAKALNCQKGPTPEPCGECASCREITQGSSPDVFEIDAASNRGIDDIRELRENVRYSPVGGRYKIYIIDEVHRLTKEAFDALLKTLEEPPSHVIFMFATTDPQALPPTILSRTQRYDFKRIPVTSLVDAITSVAKKEGMAIEEEAALLVAKKADGSLRDALSLLDQLSSFGDGVINARMVAEILGLVKTEVLAKISEAIIGHDPGTALNIFGAYVKTGGDAQEFADCLSGYMRTLLLVKSGVSDPEILELDKSEIEIGKVLVQEIDLVDLLRYFTVLADYKGAIKQGQNPVYSLESALVKMASMDRAVTLDSLLSKIPNAPKTPAAHVPRSESRAGNQSGAGSVNKAAHTIDEPDSNLAGDTLPSLELAEGPMTFEFIAENWSGFCGMVRKSKASTFAHLSNCNLHKFEGGILTLSADISKKFQLEQLSRPDNKRFLEDSLRLFFKTDLKLNLVHDITGQKGAPEMNIITDPDKLFEGSPEMRKLYDDLGGEIIGQ